jgi:Ca2+-binding EF-hand superfamily protein
MNSASLLGQAAFKGESTNAQDVRIEELFRALDVADKGYLDLKNLRAGLKRIDHRV